MGRDELGKVPAPEVLRDLISGAGLEETIAALTQIDALKEETPLKGSLDEPAFVSELFGQRVEIPVNWMRLPDRTLDYIHFRVKPGNGFGKHLHAYGEEVYFITGGRGKVRIGETEYDAASGDVFHLRRNTWHDIWNPAANVEELSFLLVNAPSIRYELRAPFWPIFDGERSE